MITKNIVGEIKQLDESDEGTVVFVTYDLTELMWKQNGNNRADL